MKKIWIARALWTAAFVAFLVAKSEILWAIVSITSPIWFPVVEHLND